MKHLSHKYSTLILAGTLILMIVMFILFSWKNTPKVAGTPDIKMFHGSGYTFEYPSGTFLVYDSKKSYWRFGNDIQTYYLREVNAAEDAFSLVPSFAGKPQSIVHTTINGQRVSTATYKMSNTLEGYLFGEPNNKNVGTSAFVVDLAQNKRLFFFIIEPANQTSDEILSILSSIKKVEESNID